MEGVDVPIPDGHVVRLPSSDLDMTIRVSYWRRFLTVLSVTLAVTDVPRVGVITRPCNQSDAVLPGTVMCWGPYEYSVAHLHSNESGAVVAACDDEPLEALDVWTYKYDTLSIAIRAIAQQFNVSSYPACLLYRELCTSTTLEPSTVFHMLDGLVTTIQRARFSESRMEVQPFMFFTKSNWVDRVHQALFTSLTKNPEQRLHAVYHVSSRDRDSALSFSLQLCSARLSSHSRSFVLESRPLFCDHPLPWKCDHPTEPTGKHNVPIWDHISLRFEHLQSQYPHLKLDATVVLSTIVEQTHSDSRSVPSVNVITEAMEIVTLIRGRMCDKDAVRCKTVFLDDYRYERVALESDKDRWTHYLWLLRGASQAYIWLRLVLLVWGCYRARVSEIKYRQHSVVAMIPVVVRTLLLIPAHTVVYGSWFPIIGYSLAHYFDSGLVHMTGEYTWSSIDGLFAFDPLDYIVAASVQMRNIWMIALALNLLSRGFAAITTKNRLGRHREYNGVFTFRTGWMGLVAWLTTFSMARSLEFRDTQVLSMIELPRHIPIQVLRSLSVARNYTDYGLRFDLKAIFAASVAVAAAAWLFRQIVRVVTGQTTNWFVCQSFYVPFSAKSIWSWSACDPAWTINWNNVAHGWIQILPLRSPGSRVAFKSSTALSCPACSFRASPLHWRSTQGCPIHELIFSVHHRTKELWSMVRLSNIANMTDPIVLVWLYFIGVPLYVYRVQIRDRAPYLLLMPTSNLETAKLKLNSKPGAVDCTTDQDAQLTVEGVVSSRDMPWHVLVHCG